MSAAVEPAYVIDTPGVYSVPFDQYLRDPVPGGSLSTSGAKTLLNTCPAIFDWQRTHGRPDKKAFDVGHAAHAEVLGDGMEIRVIPDELLGANGSASTNAAKAFIASARAAGAVPIKSGEAAEVFAMGEALRAHPRAGRILDPSRGAVEQSVFWIDERTGIWRRARYDYMREEDDGGRLVIVDFKTADDLADRLLANAIGRYGYDQQSAWYCDGAKALSLSDDPRFLFIFQAKTPPYLVRVIELPDRWVEIGREKNDRALDLFAECSAAGEWPGYSLDVEVLEPPAWVEYEQEDMVI